MKFFCLALSAFMTLGCFSVHAASISIETALSELVVDVEGDKNVFAVPFDYRDNMIFTVHVEPPGNGGKEEVNLRTVVRKGTRQVDGTWKWEAQTIEDRTIRDTWHTQASIALDSKGFVHVAYNMHNMPWQYSVSEKPFDISGFKFRGQKVSQKEIETVRFKNKIPFPDIGTADISGNQVTYPMFFTDKNGDLYLTYRFALKPARSWDKRAFAGAIAKYNIENKIWEQIGGPFVVQKTDAALPQGKKQAVLYPFAFENTYSVYLITLAFDIDNGMHVFWNWRPDGAGMETINPSYAYSQDGKRFFRSDGQAYAMPISFNQSEVIATLPAAEYYASKSVAVNKDRAPMAIVHNIKEGRQLIVFDKEKRRWSMPEPTPASASEIVIDRFGRQWAFASGLRIFNRGSENEAWKEFGQIGSGLGFQKVKYISKESRFIIHAKSADGKKVSIFSFKH